MANMKTIMLIVLLAIGLLSTSVHASNSFTEPKSGFLRSPSSNAKVVAVPPLMRILNVERRDASTLEVTIGTTELRAEKAEAKEIISTFSLQLDSHMFASDAKVQFGEGQEGNAVSTKKTYIYIGKNDMERGDWGSITIENEDEDNGIVVSGAFSSTKLGGDFHFEATEDRTSHTVRRLEDIEEFKDIATVFPGDEETQRRRKSNRRRNRRVTKSPTSKSATTTVSTSDDNIFFPGCFPGDSAPLSVQIGIATDAGFMERINFRTPGLSSEADQRAAVVREVERSLSIVRPLYLAQLNVQLQIQSIIVGNVNHASPVLRRKRGMCPGDPLAALSQFSSWARTAPVQTAHWHLLTDCYPNGVIGAGYIGGLCSNFGAHVAFSSFTDYLWLTVAHEIGHVFGAHHTFMRGQGGIMDYGSGRLFGKAVQFHPDNKEDMCGEITDVIRGGSCPYVKATKVVSICGNGVLEPAEECECAVGNDPKSCGSCVECKLSTPRQCAVASDGFVVRHFSTPDFVSTSDPSLVAHPDCCSPQGQLRGQSCSKGRDVCSVSGQCKKACATFFLTPCGFDESGCIQKCFAENKCQGIELTTQGPPPIPAGAVPDGVRCLLPGRISGQCIKGVCSSTVTKSPTPASTQAEQESDKPTASPTPIPTSSRPTPKPSSAPSTMRPSNSPTEPPTVRCPGARQVLDCPNLSTYASCTRAGCSWCGPNNRRCQAAEEMCMMDARGIRQAYGHCAPFRKDISSG